MFAREIKEQEGLRAEQHGTGAQREDGLGGEDGKQLHPAGGSGA